MKSPIVIALVWSAIMFSGAAFIEWDVYPGNWSCLTRTLFVVFGMFGCFAVIVGHMVDEKNKK